MYEEQTLVFVAKPLDNVATIVLIVWLLHPKQFVLIATACHVQQKTKEIPPNITTNKKNKIKLIK